MSLESMPQNRPAEQPSAEPFIHAAEDAEAHRKQELAEVEARIAELEGVFHELGERSVVGKIAAKVVGAVPSTDELDRLYHQRRMLMNRNGEQTHQHHEH